MKDIAFVSVHKTDDKRSWSGTIYSMHELLKQKYNVYDISSGSSVIRRAISHIPDNRFGLLDIIKDRSLKLYDVLYFERKINKAFKSGIKIFFLPIMSEVISHIKKPENASFIYLSDATFHALDGYYYKKAGKECSIIKNGYEQKSLEVADASVFSSVWAKNDAIDFYHSNPERAYVIPFGPNFENTEYTPKEYDNTHIECLFVGVDPKRKGLDKAIDCVCKLNKAETCHSYSLTVIGSDKPADRDYPEYIRFVGTLNKNIPEEYNKLVSYYRRSDLFILPTVAECSPIVICEASMFGLPVFSHFTGGIPDTYVENGYNGRLLPLSSSASDFADAIKSAAEEDKLKEYSHNSRKKYEEELNWNNWIDKFSNIVERFS